MYLSSPFTSLVDFPSEVSLFLPLEGCSHSCPFCFNADLRSFIHSISLEEIKERINEDREFVTAVMMGGADVTLQLDDALEIAKYSRSLGLKVGMQVSGLNLSTTKNITESNAIDYISITTNSFISSLQKQSINYLANNSDIFVEVKVVHVPQRVELGTFLQGLEYGSLVVQQFRNENCLDPEYESIPSPNREEVMNFGRKIGANEMVTKERGREKIEY